MIELCLLLNTIILAVVVYALFILGEPRGDAAGSAISVGDEHHERIVVWDVETTGDYILSIVQGALDLGVAKALDIQLTLRGTGYLKEYTEGIIRDLGPNICEDAVYYRVCSDINNLK